MVGLIALLCTTPWSQPRYASAKGPAPYARIVYTAETQGQLHPCGTCGTTATGGMARRATLLAQLAAETPPPLIIAGPGEFTPPHEPHLSPPISAPLAAIFARMPYHALYAKAPESGASATNPHLPALVFVGDAPVTRLYRAGTLRAACIFFPQGKGGTAPSPDQLAAVRQAAQNAAQDADLVIGISPWGITAENAAAPFLAGFVHILLGGGKGLAIPGQATGSPASPGPLWARAASLGRAVVVLDIFSLPQGPSAAWLEGVHFSPRLILLDQTIHEEPAMARLTARLP